MVLDRDPHAALLAERRGVGQDLGDVDVLIFPPHPEIERVLLSEGLRVRNLLAHGRGRLGKRTAVGTVRLAIVVVRPRAASFCLSAAIDSGVTGVDGATSPLPASRGCAGGGGRSRRRGTDHVR